MEKQNKGPFIIAYDTLADGWQCWRDGDGAPLLYDTEAEAEKEIREEFEELNRARVASGGDPDEEPQDFVIPLNEFIPGRKAIFTGGNPPGYIAGGYDTGPGTVAAWLEKCPFQYTITGADYDGDGETITAVFHRAGDAPEILPAPSYELPPAWLAGVLDITEAEAGRVITQAYECEYFYSRLIEMLEEIGLEDINPPIKPGSGSIAGAKE